MTAAQVLNLSEGIVFLTRASQLGMESIPRSAQEEKLRYKNYFESLS